MDSIQHNTYKLKQQSFNEWPIQFKIGTALNRGAKDLNGVGWGE